MSGHTPGPWRVSTQNEFIFGAVRGNGMEPIGFVYAPAFAERSEVGRRAMANARLIAAAPELLEQLQSAVLQMEMAASCIEAGRIDEALLHASSLMRQKREAIAKATQP